MDKTSWTVVIACVTLLFLWQVRYGAEQAKHQAHAREIAAAQAAVQAEAAALAKPVAPPPVIAPPPVPEAPVVKGELSADQVVLRFTSRGGGISEVELPKHEAKGEARVLINADGNLPIGALTDAEGRSGWESWQMEVGEGKARFWREPRAGVRIEKEFLMPPVDPTKDPYVTEVSVRWRNGSPDRFDQPGVWVAMGQIGSIHRSDWPLYTAASWWRGGRLSVRDVTWFDARRVPLVGIVTRPETQFFQESGDGIEWGGVKNQFFTSVLTPREDLRATGVWARRLDAGGRGAERRSIEGALGLAGFTLAPGEERQMRFQLYTGPTEYGRLKRFDHHEAEILNYGMFGFVSKPLHFALLGLHGLVHDYGVAIILLTIMIKSALWPMQNRSTQSMKRMSALSPKINELREKYKDDPTRMNKEMMDLYKKNGVNPLAGCLPMFMQIPIFFGFYKMLQVAVELRLSPFLWVRDLSQPDTIFHMHGVPIIGDLPINVLPLVMAGTMVWQMVISPKSGDATQQRIFYFMPIIFLGFCYNFASALALYWTVQNLFSIVQLYATRNRPTEVAKAAAPAGGAPGAVRGVARPMGAPRRRKP